MDGYNYQRRFLILLTETDFFRRKTRVHFTGDREQKSCPRRRVFTVSRRVLTFPYSFLIWEASESRMRNRPSGTQSSIEEKEPTF